MVDGAQTPGSDVPRQIVDANDQVLGDRDHRIPPA
jgi:hypothetical protein